MIDSILVSFLFCLRECIFQIATKQTKWNRKNCLANQRQRNRRGKKIINWIWSRRRNKQSTRTKHSRTNERRQQRRWKQTHTHTPPPNYILMINSLLRLLNTTHNNWISSAWKSSNDRIKTVNEVNTSKRKKVIEDASAPDLINNNNRNK